MQWCISMARCVPECRILEPVKVSRDTFEAIWKEHPEERHVVRVFGKSYPTPRWTASYLHEYAYSGTVSPALPLPECLEPLYKKALAFDPRFNQVMLNWYADGTHYMGAHSDDEPSLISDAPIMSISLGATRTFRIRDRVSKTILQDVPLKNGTCLVMESPCQQRYLHEIVKMNGKKGKGVGRRINITFRCFAA